MNLWQKVSTIAARLVSKQEKTRLEQVEEDPWRRVDSDEMTDVEKMDKGFNGKTYTRNGIEVDF
tara:strand:+ start:1992 stop:2183 length:192 start_codon:yes stop_codon:yes gene_type:complete